MSAACASSFFKAKTSSCEDTHVHDPAEVFGVRLRRLAVLYKVLVGGGQNDNMTGEYFGPQSVLDHANDVMKEETRENLLLAMREEAAWHLRSVCLLQQGADQEGLWRFAWQRAQCQALITHLDNLLGGPPLSYLEQASLMYDCTLDPAYASDQAVQNVLARLGAALPGSGSVAQRWHKVRDPFMISRSDYEGVFREVLAEVHRLAGDTIPFEKWQLKQQYFADPADNAEAYCVYNGNLCSTMKVNIARPIDLCKAQQLASHELTHHMQFCFAEEHLLKYPEFQCDFDFSPWGFLLEAGAEVAVDALFTPQRRKAHLQRISGQPAAAVQHMVELDVLVWRELWRHWTAVGQGIGEKRLIEQEAAWKMEHEGLKKRDSWPNVDFMQQYGPYLLGYGWGSELLRQYLRSTGAEDDLWPAYVQFMKRPWPPSVLFDHLRR